MPTTGQLVKVVVDVREANYKTPDVTIEITEVVAADFLTGAEEIDEKIHSLANEAVRRASSQVRGRALIAQSEQREKGVTP